MSNDRKTKEFARKPYSTFKNLRNRLPEQTNIELGAVIGYGASAISAWEREGTVPAVAVLALEALIRRQTSGAKALTPKIMLVSFTDKDSVAFFEMMAEKITGMKVLYSSKDE